MSIIQLLIGMKDGIIKLEKEKLVKLFPRVGKQIWGKAKPFFFIGSRDKNLKAWMIGSGSTFSKGEKGRSIGKSLSQPRISERLGDERSRQAPSFHSPVG
jgi:hypothetical protein